MSAVFDRTSELASRFATTRWDIVLASAQTQTPGADEALSDLCRSYWRPLYAFVRRRGHSASDAEDLVQGFFARFLDDRAVKKADPQRGRFRTFLLSSLENFMANEWDRTHAEKRGGKFHFVSVDELAAEEHHIEMQAEGESAEQVFDRRWAEAIVATAMTQLRGEAEARGKGKAFDELRCLLTGDSTSYETVAQRLNIPLTAAKTAVHRLRANFRGVVRREVARTVTSPNEIDDELRYLSSILASRYGGRLTSN